MQANDDMTTNENKIKNLLLPLITAEVQRQKSDNQEKDIPLLKQKRICF
jgi:hypothetical protein